MHFSLQHQGEGKSNWDVLFCFAETLCFPAVWVSSAGWISWGAALSFSTQIFMCVLTVSELLGAFGSVWALCMLELPRFGALMCITLCGPGEDFSSWGSPSCELHMLFVFPLSPASQDRAARQGSQILPLWRGLCQSRLAECGEGDVLALATRICADSW